MSVWREVKEALYKRWKAQWGTTTYYVFGDGKASPPENAVWARFRVVRGPGGGETLGPPGGRKYSRGGLVSVLLYRPPQLAGGEGLLDDLGEQAKDIFEGVRIKGVHDTRILTALVNDIGELDGGRWLALSVEVPFDYEERK